MLCFAQLSYTMLQCGPRSAQMCLLLEPSVLLQRLCYSADTMTLCVQELCQKIIKGVYNTPAHVSPEAKDLLARMLTVVPDHRITFQQVPSHLVLCVSANYFSCEND